MSGFDPRRTYETGDRVYNNDGLYDGWNYKGPNNTDWVVELGVDLSANGIGDWFTLDDPVKGELDNTEYLLTGDVLVDLTRYVRNISTNRGRSRELEKFTTGTCQVVFDNRDRIFDPLIQNGPFSGQIIPRKQIRVRYLGEPVFTGNVDDWDYDYTDTDATATVKAVDGFQFFATRNVSPQTMVVESVSDRIIHVLDEIGWPADARSIDASSASVGGDVVGDNVNALSYLQKLELSDNGLMFMTADGLFKFDDSYYGTLHPAVIGDDGIRFQNIDVTYGSEELINQFDVSYYSGSATATATVNDLDSQAAYGKFERGIDTLLSGSVAAIALGQSLLFRYSEPQYRVDGVEFDVRAARTEDRSLLLNLDLGNRVALKWRPLGVGEPVSRTVLVDGIAHVVSPGSHKMNLRLTDLGYSGEAELLSGGKVSEYKDGGVVYRLHEFTEPGVYDLEVAAPVTVDALIVAAGGGKGSGGAGTPGGGGAGGVLYGSHTFTSASTYQVIVGAFTQGANGGNSQLGNEFVAVGGGRGGIDAGNGQQGGSGGGGGVDPPSIGSGGLAQQTTIGSLTGYGNNGTPAFQDGKGDYYSGAGGGAGGAASGAVGGAPFSASITGVSASYAAGGNGSLDGLIGTSTGYTPNPGDGHPAPTTVFWLENANGVVYVRYQL